MTSGTLEFDGEFFEMGYIAIVPQRLLDEIFQRREPEIEQPANAAEARRQRELRNRIPID
jgi:hypothetical protein